MAPRRVDQAARREEVLSSAIRVFARQGFAATRIEDVAAEAGVAKGSVYLSFDSRDALLTAAAARLAEHMAHLLEEARAPHGRAVDRLAALLRSTVASLAGHPELARVLVDLWAAERTPALGETLDMAAVYRDHRAVITELLLRGAREGDLRAGVGAAEAAVVVGAVEGCLIQWLVDPSVPFAELADPIIEVCLSGLRT
ncbi:TetR/AcrR family transcriptional regulator [Nocardiopsis sp. MG754419]|uniref:TetR/AcrR family transcriptional regulator n=1 Tax=Nocardiopsis sp. MG754419 TaxID=2259865 RepID=UPI001BA5C0C3|nr:TetR/AcrR family transcriptional regulator [Nocardiopsis sp. MG754419]MBR8745171.1 TetR/AcrR family transcriptional regulator [Nocardiopsis sp. MG754419]